MLVFGEGAGVAAQVQDVFTTAATDVSGAVLAIAAVAAGILVIFLAFRYGKKIFKSVAS